MRNIILIRHAEAWKNLEDRHGGSGGDLTARGEQQTREFAKDAPHYFGNVPTVLAGNKPQCIATASILAAACGAKYRLVENLEPFYLGVLDGLSKSEAAKKYPVYADTMERWRRGFNEIDALQIPGASNLADFYAQGKEFERSLRREAMPVVFVGTRSLLVLMWNVFRNRLPVPGGGYFERPWDNLEWVEFSASSSWRWREERTQRLNPRDMRDA